MRLKKAKLTLGKFYLALSEDERCEILLKELENVAKSEPTESKKGESLIQPENPKYEIPTDKNIE